MLLALLELGEEEYLLSLFELYLVRALLPFEELYEAVGNLFVSSTLQMAGDTLPCMYDPGLNCKHTKGRTELCMNALFFTWGTKDCCLIHFLLNYLITASMKIQSLCLTKLTRYLP